MALPMRLVQGTSQYRTYRTIGWGIFILAIVLIGFAYADAAQIGIGENKYSLSLIGINRSISFIIAILGLQVVVGFTGQVALGQSFFFGTGAYICAYFVQDLHWSFGATLAVVVPACFLIGVLVGIPALRIHGLYLALVTLGMAAVFPSIVQLDSLFKYTNGAGGKIVDSKLVAPSWFPADQIAELLQKIPLLGQYFGDGPLSERETDRIWKYTLFVILTAICFWLVSNLVRSRPGRAIRAIRDNETGASVAGINLALNKTLSFGFSAALGGVAGIVYVAEIGIAAPGEFTQLLAINLIVGLVVGGVGTLSGAVVGGLMIGLVPEWASSTEHLPVVPERWLSGPTGSLFLGISLIALTFFLPGGIVAGTRKLKARFVQIVPKLAAMAAAHRASIAVEPLDPASQTATETPENQQELTYSNNNTRGEDANI